VKHSPGVGRNAAHPSADAPEEDRERSNDPAVERAHRFGAEMVVDAAPDFEHLRDDLSAHGRLLAKEVVGSRELQQALSIAAARAGTIPLHFSTAVNPRQHSDGTVRWIDVDDDGVADLALVDEVVYGPSEGFNVFVRHNTEFQQVFLAAGRFVQFGQLQDRVKLRFLLEVLGPEDTRAQVALVLDRKTHRWTHPPASCAALQTQMPKLRAEGSVELRSGDALRFAPAVDNSRAPSPPDGEKWTRTPTLRGNVVVELGATAKATVLGRAGTWLYVSVPQSRAIRRTSLHQGGNFVEYVDLEWVRYEGWFLPRARGD
jgi:hypothetical protein